MSIHRSNSEGSPDDADLERILARQPFRPLPTEWRDTILGSAAASDRSLEPSSAFKSEPRIGSWYAELRGIWDRVSSGWAVVAAAWAVILALEQFAASPTGAGAGPRAPLSASALATLRAQQRELLGQLATTTAPEPPAPPPAERPRAAREDDLERTPVASTRWGLPFVCGRLRSIEESETSTPC